MNIYNYDEFGVYTGTTEAMENPRNIGTFLMPAKATAIECLYPQNPNEVAVFSEENQEWSLVEDYRGLNAYSDTDCIVIEALGALPVGYTLEKPPAYIEMENYLEFKSTRAGLVAAILVTVNGKTYQGDETSQDRMVRAIIAAESGGLSTIPFWVLADNTVYADIPLAEFKQVLIDSMGAMAALWVYVP